MSKVSYGTKKITTKLRFALLAAFFNFIKNSLNPELLNPCDNPALRKLFKAGKPTQFHILEKDVVDEIIFRTRNPRNRLMLELMARSCLCVCGVLKLTPNEILNRKLILNDNQERKRGGGYFPSSESCGSPTEIYQRQRDRAR